MTSRPNPKAFMYLALSTVVIGGALCYFQYTKLGEVKGRVSKLKTEVSDPNAVKARLDDSSMKLEGAKQSLMHLEANVSSAAYVPSLLRDLDGYGKQNGLAVTGVRPAVKKPGEDAANAKLNKPYDELNIQVTGTGTFDSVEKFVTNLPSFPKIVAARMVSIEPARSSGADAVQGLLNVTVQLKAYVFKADAPAGILPATAAPGTGAPGATNSGAPAPAANGAATPAAGKATPAGVSVKPGAAAPATTPATTTAPAAKHPGPIVKTALARARRVRVEG